jgi:putative ABC transport system permease protein
MVLALALTRGMQSLLFDVSAVDPMIYLGVAGLVVIVAWLSNFLPALRASRGNPIATLRAD